MLRSENSARSNFRCWQGTGFWRNRSSGHWLRWVCFRRVERRSSFVRSRRLPPNSPIACRSCKLASCRWSHSTKSRHLRPGSYDITAPAYCHAEDFFANTHRRGDAPKVDESWTLTTTERQAIEEVLATDECPFASPDQLFDYVEAATRAREYSKFVFQRALFFILEQIAEFGQRHDITRQELALLEVGMLMQCTGETNEIEMSALRAAIDEARTKYEIDVLVHLPQIIDRPESYRRIRSMCQITLRPRPLKRRSSWLMELRTRICLMARLPLSKGQTQASIGCFQQILSGLSRNMVV